MPNDRDITGRHPVPRSPRAWLAWLWHTAAVAPWDRIDARDKGQPRVGRLSARAAALVTAITGALMLVLLRYVVMDSGVQDQLAFQFERAVAALAPSWGRDVVRAHDLWVHLAWIAGCCVVYVAVPGVVLHALFGLRLRDAYAVPTGYLRKLPIYLLLFLPVAAAVLPAARAPEFQLQYPFYTGRHLWDQLTWEIAYGVQFLALEFFFRGFLLRGLSAEMGASAVVAMVMPYCMLHYGKPLPECIGSIAAGTVLGILAMDTRSIWGGVTIHVAVAWSMDAAALAHKAGRAAL